MTVAARATGAGGRTGAGGASVASSAAAAAGCAGLAAAAAANTRPRTTTLAVPSERAAAGRAAELAREAAPGNVATGSPEYINTVQGTVSQSDNPLSLAISGQGYFSVSQGSSSGNGTTAFSIQPAYTRAGDFQLDKSGYLVNSAGNYLNGWKVDASGVSDTTNLKPILVNQATFNPVATSQMTVSANLVPSATPLPTPAPTASSVEDVYDQEGTAHQLTLTYTATGANTWSVGVADDTGASIGTANLTFAANGTLSEVVSGGVDNTTAGSAATMTLTTTYPATSPAGAGTQSIALNLGAIGSTTGLTQFAGTAYTPRGISQDGVPPGSFSSLTTTSAGGIIANYDNGQSRTIAQVPITTFQAPDQLQRLDGSAFSATLASGNPLTQASGNNGAGKIDTQSVEASNVDISSEFTKLIVAQQAYSANAKLITTANDLLQVTVNMKQ